VGSRLRAASLSAPVTDPWSGWSDLGHIGTDLAEPSTEERQRHAAVTLTSLTCCSARWRWLLRWGAGPLCGAFMASMAGVRRSPGRRLTTLEVVCGATCVGSGFLSGRCGTCDIVGTSRRDMASLPKHVDCGRGGGRSGGCQWRSWGGATEAWQAVVDANGWQSWQLVRAAGRGSSVVDGMVAMLSGAALPVPPSTWIVVVGVDHMLRARLLSLIRSC
jgi:hypothetical protein